MHFPYRGRCGLRPIVCRPARISAYAADARCSIEEFEAVVGREIVTEDEEEDIDTLGGLVFSVAGRVPERGEVIVHPGGFEFEVTDADPRRVRRVVVRETETPGTDEATESA